MKRYIAVISALLALMLLLCGCGKEEELGAWEMPAVDAKPTPVATAIPTFGGGSPESFVWNEALYFSMSNPGVSSDSVQHTYSHEQCAELFPYNFMPAAIFNESYARYDKLSLKKNKHDVMLHPAELSLAENAYVEYVFSPKGSKETESLYVMAELCSYPVSEDIYFRGTYPHINYADGARPSLSKYYFKEFVLTKYGEQRIAQVLKLTPSSYFTDSEKALVEAEANGEVFVPQRQILLTITCGLDMSDEEFIAAVCSLVQFSDGSELPPPENALPKPGEKGAA